MPDHPTLTSIIATLGPASESPVIVRKLIRAGVSVFRLNFSHGTLEQHAQRVATVRAAARELGAPTAILGDLQGPKIRIGVLPEPGEMLKAGDDVLLFPHDSAGPAGGRPLFPRESDTLLPTTYAGLEDDVRPGDRVLINDGAVRLLTLDSEGDDPTGTLRCRVTLGGLVTSSKGINLPDSDIKAPAVTERDWRCVEWAVATGLDFLALSFVRTAEEVRQLKRALAGMCPVDFAVEHTGEGAMIPVVAKIEKPQAVANIDDIVKAADAIMVARGDLGVEMDLAQVPVVQRRLIEKAGEWGKPCIVATQMLESMIERPAPTRAEASDVAHAIFDGADAVMLSAETATGRDPVLVVETMRRIIAEAESEAATKITAPSPPRKLIESKYRTAALAHGAWYIARDLGARLIVCWSQHGGAARYLSQNGLAIPIIAYSSDERQTRRMALLKGVTAIHSRVLPSGTLAEWNEQVDRDLVARGWARPGDPIVLIAGRPLGHPGSATTVAVHYLANPATGFRQHR